MVEVRHSNITTNYLHTGKIRWFWTLFRPWIHVIMCSLLYFLLSQVHFSSPTSSSCLAEVCRSSSWRSRWVSSPLRVASPAGRSSAPFLLVCCPSPKPLCWIDDLTGCIGLWVNVISVVPWAVVLEQRRKKKNRCGGWVGGRMFHQQCPRCVLSHGGSDTLRNPSLRTMETGSNFKIVVHSQGNRST